MLVQELSEELISKWNQFLHQSNNGTIFHDLEFLAYHSPGKFNTSHLIFRKDNNQICAIMPGALVNENDKLILLSPYGASMGGFVTAQRIHLGECIEIVESLVIHAKEKAATSIVLTPVPTIYHTTPHHQMDFALFTSGFKYIKRLLISALDLRCIQKDPMDMFIGSVRGHIRKAVKSGVTVSESNQYPEFYKILMENKQKHGALPTHTLDELLDIQKRLPSKIRLFMAFLDKIPIAGVLVFICNEKVAYTFYICHLNEYHQYNAVSLILYDIVKKFKELNFSYLDLGPSIYPDMTISWGVLKFKESLNTMGYFRDTWHLDIE
jgi:hypothetical protein